MSEHEYCSGAIYRFLSPQMKLLGNLGMKQLGFFEDEYHRVS